jgi:GT2 family glycosyltransferase
MITVSVVSHGHRVLVSRLLDDLARCPEVERVVLTYNVPEEPAEVPQTLAPRLQAIWNDTPKGFGANHNAAFTHCRTSLFCVVNPDVRIHRNPFPELLKGPAEGVALSAPMVVDPDGHVEDSFRRFPTPLGLLLKATGIHDGRLLRPAGNVPLAPDWVAGMFMLFQAEDFAALDGFDEGYFLYYEDVDLCTRIWRSGRSIRVFPAAEIVHDARRESHRNLKYLRWHLGSMARYMFKHMGRLPEVAR